MGLSISIRFPFVTVKPKPVSSSLQAFPIQKPDIPHISANALATHPQAGELVQRAKKLYAAGHLRRASDTLITAAGLFACGHSREPWAAISLVETAAKTQMFLGRKKIARKYLNACAELADSWGFPYMAKEYRRRSDEIR